MKKEKEVIRRKRRRGGEKEWWRINENLQEKISARYIWIIPCHKKIFRLEVDAELWYCECRKKKKIRKYFMVIISFLVAYRHWPGKTTIPSWF